MGNTSGPKVPNSQTPPVPAGARHFFTKKRKVPQKGQCHSSNLSVPLPGPSPVISSCTHPILPVRRNCDGDIQRRKLLLQLHVQGRLFRVDQTTVDLDRGWIVSSEQFRE